MKPYKLALIPASLLAMTSFAFAGETKADDVVFAEGAVTASLTGVAGDAANGRKVFANRKQGNCLACHVNTDLSEQPFHGEVGPPLDGVAGRWEEAQLRGILVNSKNTFEGSIMPSFYRMTNGARPLKKFDGKTILSAQQVEDVLAYLKTLQE